MRANVQRLLIEAVAFLLYLISKLELTSVKLDNDRRLVRVAMFMIARLWDYFGKVLLYDLQHILLVVDCVEEDFNLSLLNVIFRL